MCHIQDIIKIHYKSKVEENRMQDQNGYGTVTNQRFLNDLNYTIKYYKD